MVRILPVNSVFFLMTLGVLLCQTPLYAAGNTELLKDILPESPIPERQVIQTGDSMPVWKTLWDEARKSVQTQHYHAAIEKYNALLASKPHLQSAQWELAGLYALTEEWEKADSLLEALWSAHPEQLIYARELAQIKLARRQFIRAAELFDKVLEAQPDDLTAVRGKSLALLSQGENRQALPFLESIAASTGSRKDRLQLAETYWELERMDEAAPLFAELAMEEEAAVNLLRKAAWAYQKSGQPKNAIRFWKMVSEREGQNLEAHKQLAALYEKQGNLSDALVHMRVLLEQKPDDAELHLRIGKALVGQSAFAESLPHYDYYLQAFPADKGTLRTVIKIKAALGLKKQTLAALESYLAVEKNPEKSNLEQAAFLYDEQGDSAEAIELYRRLLTLSPDDPEILQALANNLLKTGQEQDALDVWTKLARLKPGVLEIYRPLAMLLEKRGSRRDLIKVLEAIHELDPDDTKVIKQLAGYAFEDEDANRLQQYVALLPQSETPDQQVLQWRIAVYATIGDDLKAFEACEQLWALNRESNAVGRQCLVLAGRLGQMAKLADFLPAGDEPIDLSERFLAADALFKSGNPAAAREYLNGVVTDGNLKAGQDDVWLQCVLLLAQSYAFEGLHYEQEQVLRLGLLAGDHAEEILLERLFFLALAREHYSDADAWLALLLQNPAMHLSHKLLLDIVLDAVFERNRSLHSKLRQLQQRSYQLTNSRIAPPEVGWWLAADDYAGSLFTEALVFLYQTRSYETVNVLLEVFAKQHVNVKEKILIAVLHREVAASLPDEHRWEDLALNHFSQQLILVKIADQLGLSALEEETARQMLNEQPNSFVAGYYLGRALASQGQSSEAFDIFADLRQEYPGDANLPFLAFAQLQAGYKSGALDDASRLCNELSGEGAYEPQANLLLARVEWLQQKWQAALDRYDQFLKISVGKLIEEKIDQYDVALSYKKNPKSIRQFFNITPYMDAGPAEAVYNPRQFRVLLDAREKDFLREVTGMYAAYRWQALYLGEYQAKIALKREEYNGAVKQLEKMIADYPDQYSLYYDLAGAYSKTGKVREEALIYEALSQNDIHFAGMEKARQRNMFKRRPLLRAAYGYNRQEGRQDYVSMEHSWVGLEAWYAPFPQHELLLKSTYNNYSSLVRDDKVRSQRVGLEYSLQVLTGLRFEAEVAHEGLNTGGAQNTLVRLETETKFSDMIRGTFRFSRDLVADTTAALRREIIRHDLIAAAVFEFIPRLEVGGQYIATDYSDNNWTTGYDISVAYDLITSPALFQLTYGYQFMESKEGQEPQGAMQQDGFSSDDHPYWAPKNYWTNQFGGQLKHDFSSDRLDRDLQKYYAVSYALGHDSDGYAFQKGSAEIMYEISSQFALRGEAEIVSSSPYRKKQFSVSASYRW